MDSNKDSNNGSKRRNQQPKKHRSSNNFNDRLKKLEKNHTAVTENPKTKGTQSEKAELVSRPPDKTPSKPPAFASSPAKEHRPETDADKNGSEDCVLSDPGIPQSPTPRKRKSPITTKTTEPPKRLRSQEIVPSQNPVLSGVYLPNGPPQFPSPVQLHAVFENGMRKSLGRGRMEHDYTGVVLPMLEEYGGKGSGPKMAPWLLIGKDYNVGSGIERLNVEVAEFLTYMARSPAEIDGRTNCTRRYSEAIVSYFSLPNHTVQLYGSDATGMGLPTCDIDLMIVAPSLNDPNPYKAREKKVQALQSLEQAFVNSGMVTSSLVREEASVPILELVDAKTTLEIDISFEAPHVFASLDEVDHWKFQYGEGNIVHLVILLKQCLGMRKLGFGTATMPYQGGVGSYIILCMVVLFLDRRSQTFRMFPHLTSETLSPGRLFLDLLKFWGVEFDYDNYAIQVNPPAITRKSPGIPPYIFEVRSPFDRVTNIAASMFGTRHIKETLGYFYNVMQQRIQAIDLALQQQQQQQKTEGCKENAPSSAPPLSSPRRFGPDFGILGLIIAGKYEIFETRRRTVSNAMGILGPDPHFISPHILARQQHLQQPHPQVYHPYISQHPQQMPSQMPQQMPQQISQQIPQQIPQPKARKQTIVTFSHPLPPPPPGLPGRLQNMNGGLSKNAS